MGDLADYSSTVYHKCSSEDLMKTVHVLALVALAVTMVSGQPREGLNKEVSVSGSYQNYSSGSSSGGGAFLASTRLGFFLGGGFEAEPEIVMMVTSGSEPVYMLNGNVSYNFISAARGVPFLLIGYGLANTVPFFNVPTMRMDFRVGVLNIGGGLKVFVKEDIAVRLEYRYQKFSGEHETSSYGIYSLTQKVDTRIHTVQFGLSVLL
jgi:opacity protein-like surface antigen